MQGGDATVKLNALCVSHCNSVDTTACVANVHFECTAQFFIAAIFHIRTNVHECNCARTWSTA